MTAAAALCWWREEGGWADRQGKRGREEKQRALEAWHRTCIGSHAPLSPHPISPLPPDPTTPSAGQCAWLGRTFAAPGSDLSERVVAAVALPPDDTRLAGTLSCLHVTGARVGAGGEAVTGVAGVTALRPVVIGLEKQKCTGYEVLYFYAKSLVFCAQKSCCWSSAKWFTEHSTG